ncbi:MAG: ABC transporter ATP-binding protein [Planctomycetota bacterium]|nr:ABC transporter ATP-binding protein [Planctomycetota bacterium]
MPDDHAHGGARSEVALDLRGVTKAYRGKVLALKGIDMRVGRGTVFGLLGPNGAGKSTLVKIIMTVVRPTRAEGTVLGRRVGDKAYLRQIGYLPEHNRFPDYLSGRQVLDYFGALADVPRALRRQRIEENLELVGMKGAADRGIKTYSKGMRQRIGIAQALMNDPDLLFLDEPTDGVDPVGRRDIRNLLLHLRERGKSVFLNSHILSELEMVCDRVAILVSGNIVALGTIDDLTRESQRYEIEFAGVSPAELVRVLPAVMRSIGAGVESHEGEASPMLRGQLASGVPWGSRETSLRVGTYEPEQVQPIIDALRREQLTIRSLRPIRASLEDLFMQAVGDGNAEGGASGVRPASARASGKAGS